MSAGYEILKDLSASSMIQEQFALDVLLGLSETPKTIHSKYFYDAEGSRLFQAITDLPEYYLTRCEHEILETHKDEIARLVSRRRFNLVELGPGDAHKTMLLMDRFLSAGIDFRYVPIDISEAAMQELVNSLDRRFPKLSVHGLVSSYSNGLKWLNTMKNESNFLLFMGSNIGNFNKAAARVFLRSLWNSLQSEDLVLIGFDLKKDINMMLLAYNDRQEVTARFNLNLLQRINRELGANFDLNRFRHYANYDVYSGAMESYLVSTESQDVFIKSIGQSFHFEPWEPIHTEYSYKYLESDIEELAKTTGFTVETQLYDSKHFFVDSIWRVAKKREADFSTVIS
jgi:dimethylhistidine N-methyltransferase